MESRPGCATGETEYRSDLILVESVTIGNIPIIRVRWNAVVCNVVTGPNDVSSHLTLAHVFVASGKGRWPHLDVDSPAAIRFSELLRLS